jgi:hypothetical protein
MYQFYFLFKLILFLQEVITLIYSLILYYDEEI